MQARPDSGRASTHQDQLIQETAASRQASANSLDDGGEGLARTLLAKITKAS
jgi:hypothetical protein